MMTRRRNTAPEARTQLHADLRNELDEIQDELLDLVSHFRLADQRLFDLQDVPEEFQPAATVLHKATDALDALHTRLDQLNVRMTDLFYKPGWRERLRSEMQMSTEADGAAVEQVAA